MFRSFFAIECKALEIDQICLSAGFVATQEILIQVVL